MVSLLLCTASFIRRQIKPYHSLGQLVNFINPKMACFGVNLTPVKRFLSLKNDLKKTLTFLTILASVRIMIKGDYRGGRA